MGNLTDSPTCPVDGLLLGVLEQQRFWTQRLKVSLFQDTESENGGDFVNDNVMDNKKIQDKLKEYATMTRSCSHDEVKVDVKVGETTFSFLLQEGHIGS